MSGRIDPLVRSANAGLGLGRSPEGWKGVFDKNEGRDKIARAVIPMLWPAQKVQQRAFSRVLEVLPPPRPQSQHRWHVCSGPSVDPIAAVETRQQGTSREVKEKLWKSPRESAVREVLGKDLLGSLGKLAGKVWEIPVRLWEGYREVPQVSGDPSCWQSPISGFSRRFM